MTPGRGRAARTLLAVVGFYQRAVSPVLPPRCRFVPTCSAYAVEAVELHGAARGSWLASPVMTTAWVKPSRTSFGFHVEG